MLAASTQAAENSNENSEPSTEQLQEVLSAHTKEENSLLTNVQERFGLPKAPKPNAIVFLGDLKKENEKENIIKKLREENPNPENLNLYYINVPNSIIASTHMYFEYKTILNYYYNVKAAFIFMDYSNTNNNKSTIDNLAREFFKSDSNASPQNYLEDKPNHTLFAIVDNTVDEQQMPKYIDNNVTLNLSAYITTVDSTEISKKEFKNKLLQNDTISINLEKKTEDDDDNHSDDEKAPDQEATTTKYDVRPIITALFIAPKYKPNLSSDNSPPAGTGNINGSNVNQSGAGIGPPSNQSNSLQYILGGGCFVVGSFFLWNNFYPISTASAAAHTSPSSSTLPPEKKPTATSSKQPTNTLQPVEDPQDKEDNFKLVIFFIWLILGILCFGLWATRKHGKP